MNDDLCQCGDCGIPADATILNSLTVVEYMDSSGEIWKCDMSHGPDGDDIAISKQLELAEWARLMATASVLADMIDSHRGA